MALRRPTTRRARRTAEAIAAAAACLREGGLVAMPTETVYGLAADATCDKAVAAIYAAKGRPAIQSPHRPCIHVEAAGSTRASTPEAERLASAFWPGPLTLVAARRADLPDQPARPGRLDSAGPSLAGPSGRPRPDRGGGRPLAAPSANRSGHVSPTTPPMSLADLDGRVDWILDGGPRAMASNRRSSPVSGTAAIAASRSVTREAIESALGLADRVGRPARRAKRARATGLALRAARAIFGFARAAAATGRGRARFRRRCSGRAAGARLDLSPSGDLVEAAANLFSYLRALDASGAARYRRRPDPVAGLGAAINDRLRRAAAPQEG